jgi:peroxiredoxin
MKLAIIGGLGLVVLFCASFVFFYTRAQRQAQAKAQAAAESRSAIGKPLPEVHLVATSGEAVDDQVLRKGKVVLIFLTPECDACHTEVEFLKTVVNKRSDVSFYGIITFGRKMSSPGQAESEFPFKVFYDEGFYLAPKLGINKVPIKLYLEDGIMKKAWGGATMDDEAKNTFVQWLDSV